MDRPILFSAPMVRAILAGSKTQTRRVVKLPHMNPLGQWDATTFGGPDGGRTKSGETIPLQGGIWHTRTGDHLGCPYGQPGDRLWVRETWACVQRGDCPTVIEYAADKAQHSFGPEHFTAAKSCTKAGKYRPSIHMPRFASRIMLEITGVRVERLQDISEADAVAEGYLGPDEDVADNLPACPQCNGTGLYTAFNPATGGALPDTDCRICDTPVKRYRLLWESINGLGSWDSNPFVWVVEFKRATPTPEAS